MKRLFRFIAVWNEFLSIPLALLLWFYSPTLLRMVDPTAAAYDSAVLQQVIFAIIAVLIFHGLAWFLLKLTFPEIYRFLDNDFGVFFSNLQGWRKLKLALLLFSLYFLAFVVAFKTIV